MGLVSAGYVDYPGSPALRHVIYAAGAIPAPCTQVLGLFFLQEGPEFREDNLEKANINFESAMPILLSDNSTSSREAASTLNLAIAMAKEHYALQRCAHDSV